MICCFITSVVYLVEKIYMYVVSSRQRTSRRVLKNNSYYLSRPEGLSKGQKCFVTCKKYVLALATKYCMKTARMLTPGPKLNVETWTFH